MIVVTGGLGFIGKNLVKKLIEKKSLKKKLCVVDKKNKIISKKFKYYNNDEFLNNLKKIKFAKKVKFIFHQGANSNTAEKNFKSIMIDNYYYTIELINLCEKYKIPIVYASSASVYGTSPNSFKENSKLMPANYYSISKSLVDIHVQEKIKNNKDLKIIGLRYFNVYGAGEEDKKRMASVFYHFFNQLKKFNVIKLFKGTKGFRNGEQKRDFINVSDCVDVNLFFFKNFKSGIYNVGSGIATTFNNVADKIFKANLKKKKIKYINMPLDIIDGYQNYTKANISKLRKAGYKKNLFQFIKEQRDINLKYD